MKVNGNGPLTASLWTWLKCPMADSYEYNLHHHEPKYCCNIWSVEKQSSPLSVIANLMGECSRVHNVHGPNALVVLQCTSFPGARESREWIRSFPNSREWKKVVREWIPYSRHCTSLTLSTGQTHSHSVTGCFLVRPATVYQTIILFCFCYAGNLDLVHIYGKPIRHITILILPVLHILQ